MLVVGCVPFLKKKPARNVFPEKKFYLNKGYIKLYFNYKMLEFLTRKSKMQNVKQAS